MWLEIILSIIGIIAIVVTVITRSFLMNKVVKIEVSANMPLVENDYRTEFTEGYSIGTIKSQVLCPNDTYRIEYFPIDVEQGEGVPRPPLQTVIVNKEMAKRFARGKLSGRRERVKLITRDSSKVPEEMKDTTEGKWQTKEGQLGYLKSTFGKMVSEGDEAIAEAMRTYARGQATKTALASIREENAQRRKLLDIEPKQEETKK
jgi:hypothetical protein